MAGQKEAIAQILANIGGEDTDALREASIGALTADVDTTPSLSATIGQALGAALPLLFVDGQARGLAAGTSAKAFESAQAQSRQSLESQRKKLEKIAGLGLEVAGKRDEAKGKLADFVQKQAIKNDAIVSRKQREQQLGLGPKGTSLTVNTGSSKPLEFDRKFREDLRASNGVIAEIERQMTEVEKFFDQSRPGFQIRGQFTATDAGKFKASLNALALQATKMLQGSRPSDFDLKMIQRLIQGDYSANARDVQALLGNLKRTLVSDRAAKIKAEAELQRNPEGVLARVEAGETDIFGSGKSHRFEWKFINQKSGLPVSMEELRAKYSSLDEKAFEKQLDAWVTVGALKPDFGGTFNAK